MQFNWNKTTKIFDANINSPKKINVNQGGSSSSKTYSIMQVLCALAITNHNSITTVVGQDVNNLKKGPMRDLQRILMNEPWLKMFMRPMNKTDRILPFINGSIIEFDSYEDAQDAKQGKRDFLFVTECQGVSYEVFSELELRSKKTFIDYNPSGEFWVHEHILNAGDDNIYKGEVRFIKSTFLNNPFIDENYKQRILSYKGKDEYRWQVYGLGELAMKEGLIFPDWEEVDEIPTSWDWKTSGIDFGYFNTPTTLIDVYKSGNNLYFDERIYQTDFLLKDLCAFIKQHYPSDYVAWADSAEPKMIAAMRREALMIGAAVKGPDSIKAGINCLKEYKCHYTRRSNNIRKERLNYSYKVVNDRATNDPIDDWNHAIDAIRYAVYSRTYRR